MVPSGRKATSLVSLKDEAKALKDESKAVRDEAARLEDSNKMLQRRFSTGVSELRLNSTTSHVSVLPLICDNLLLLHALPDTYFIV